jgi:acylphosphatase
MTDKSETKVARRVLFSGRVQGVGFRYTTCDVARNFAVTGYVKNLPDGRVELICEGSREESARFVDAVRQAMRGYVGEMHTTETPASGQYRGFGIQI